jgi:biotin operon repressor
MTEVGLWLSISGLARAKGVSKQAISKRVHRLEGDGLLALRAGDNGARLVNLAQYDRVSNEVTDLARATNGRHSPLADHPNVQSDTQNYTEAQARRASYEADLKKLDLDERLAKLLPCDEVEAALDLVRQTIERVLDDLPASAEALTAATVKDGAAGTRAALKKIAFDLRTKFAAEMQKLAEPDVSGQTPLAGGQG